MQKTHLGSTSQLPRSYLAVTSQLPRGLEIKGKSDLTQPYHPITCLCQQIKACYWRVIPRTDENILTNDWVVSERGLYLYRVKTEEKEQRRTKVKTTALFLKNIGVKLAKQRRCFF